MRSTLFALLLAIVCAPVLATPASERPLALEATADQLFAPHAKPGAPGAAVIVLKNGKPLLRKAWGQASIEFGAPYSLETVVRLPYSEAREFLATAAVLMQHDGLLRLDDPVRKFYPQLPAWSAKVTLWDLLNHRSGFADEWANLLLMHDSMANRFTEHQFLQFLSRQPRPEVPPGQGYLYSNSDFGLLKLVLQHVAKEPLSAWMQRRMFAPLGMTATRLDDDAQALVPRKATSYSSAPDGYRLSSPDKASPGGNYYIASSANDLAKWANTLADPGSEPARAAAILHANVRTIPHKREPHRIHGHTELKIGDDDIVLHQGVNGFTWLASVPSRNLSVVATTNGDNVASQVRSLLDALLQQPADGKTTAKPVFASKPVPASQATLEGYAGVYVWQDQERWQSERPVRKTSELLVRDGVLSLHDGSESMPLTPVGKDLFHAAYGKFSMQLSFAPTTDNGMEMGVAFDDDYPPVRMRREREAWQPAPADLARFAGRYHSPFLDYTWTVLPGEAGQLLLRRPTAADAVLLPDGRDSFRFTLQDGYGGFNAWVTFHSDGDGAPTHLTVGFPRLMDHRFDRVAAGMRAQ